MDLIYCLVRYPLDGYEAKWVDGGIVILARCEYHFIRVHENLEQHPSNNISITAFPEKVFYVMNNPIFTSY